MVSIRPHSVFNESAPPTIDHVAIAVWSIDDALSMYTERFRLRLTGNEVLPHLGVQLAFLEGTGATALQLVAPVDGYTGDQVGIRKFLEDRGEGLHHVCFQVASIDGFVSRWTDPSAIARFVGGKNLQACFLPDRANGALIELVEATAEPSQ
jgi:methylmalonyl-CoA/ethylmalonyl-CoA epimerase